MFAGPVSLKRFEEQIEAYFTQSAEAKTPYTMHGLARAVGCDRFTLLRYETLYTDSDAEPFRVAIKRARERVAEWTEQRLHERGIHPAGPIFSLKNNFGWRDVQEIEQRNTTIIMGVVVTAEQHQAELADLDQRVVEALSPAKDVKLD